MAHYLCREKYRLELHWDSIVYQNETTALLKGAYFSGPVLKNAQKIDSGDTINIDLTPQHLVVLNTYYIVKLNWGEVDYAADGSVKLADAVLTNNYLKELHKLENNDFIVIDTEKHEHQTHAFHLVYDSQVVRENKEPYTYTK